MRRKSIVLIAAAVIITAIAAVPVMLDRQGGSALAAGADSPFVQAAAETFATKADLGLALFFEPRLSADASISCSSCQQPDRAFTDGLPLSTGFPSTEYFRNPPTLLNTGQLARAFWDGRIAGNDLSTVVRDHLVEAHFMSSDARLIAERMRQIPEYEESFISLFGGEASFGKIRSALVEYLNTLKSENNPYVDFVAGDTTALSAQAQRGLTLFNGEAGCSTCHSGELLSDGAAHALGVPENPDVFTNTDRHITFRRFFKQFGIGDFVTLREDVGVFAQTHEDGDRGAFYAPSLLEAASTAPYMHNGVLTTLEDVVRFYNDGGGSDEIAPLGLTDGEVSDLVAFLESLGSSTPPVEAPELPDYQLRELGVN